MTLSDWLTAQNESASAFAERLGLSRQVVSRYVLGDRIPRPHIIERISKITGGKVGYPDFVKAREARKVELAGQHPGQAA